MMKLIITAGAIILDKQKRILLVLRHSDKKVFPNTWSVPGGKLENREALEDCVKREVKEETNINFIPTSKYTFTEHMTEKVHNISHLYFGSFSGQIYNDDSVKWYTKEELKELKIAFDYNKIINDIYSNIS